MPARKQTGTGIVSDILKKGAQFIVSKKLISRGLALSSNPIAQVASKIAGLVGLGRKRKTKKTVRGRGDPGHFDGMSNANLRKLHGLDREINTGLAGIIQQRPEIVRLLGFGRKKKKVMKL